MKECYVAMRVDLTEEKVDSHLRGLADERYFPTVNLKAGSSQNAYTRMQQHYSQLGNYYSPAYYCYAWRTSAQLRKLGGSNLIHSVSVRDHQRSEQKLINTLRLIADELKGTVAVVLHHAPSCDNRSNPCPHEEGINKTVYKTIMNGIREGINRLVVEQASAIKTAEKDIEFNKQRILKIQEGVETLSNLKIA